MYAFVDRSLATIPPDGRLLVWALRAWTSARGAGGCPPSAVGPVFARLGLIAALPPFHRAMVVLSCRGLATLSLAPPRCCRVSEDEAVLLGLFRTAAAGQLSRLRACAELMVEDEAVADLVMAITDVGRALAKAGLVQAELPSR